MPPLIHPTAYVDPGAQLGDNVEVGPFCLIERDTVIGDGTRLSAHVHIKPYTTVGKHCTLDDGVILGGLPQDLKFKGEVSYLTVGDHTTLREYVTLHRATGEGKTTRIGSHCMLMAYAHVGHNSVVHDHVIVANAAQLAGHVDIGHHVVIGGVCGVHQHIRMGPYSMVGGVSAVRQDVPPFCMAGGHPAMLYGLNTIGLRRNGFSVAERSALKNAYKSIFYNREHQPLTDRIDQASGQWGEVAPVRELIAFVSALSSRGFCAPHQVTAPQEEESASSVPTSSAAEMVGV